MSKSGVAILPRWRLPALLIVLAVMLSALVWRLLMLQVLDTDRGYEFLQDQGDARSIRKEIIPAHRGQILDRNGEPLAISTPVISVWVNPQEANPLQTDEPSDSLDAKARKKIESKRKTLQEAQARWPELAKLIGMPRAELEDRMAQRNKQFVYLRRHLPPPVSDAVATLKIPGVYVNREYRRFYPAGDVTAHLLGFTDIDDVGQEGIELAYNNVLSGMPGSKRV
ncbi:MAG TPA: hypothetical protein VFM32_04230, partial [Spongiibacteraceae bacterium]|nr:hypothetical protein [Spongiibacteraceae bacterium]